jgi:hypothetical protein
VAAYAIIEAPSVLGLFPEGSSAWRVRCDAGGVLPLESPAQ